MHNILSRISRLQNNSTVFGIKLIISELFKGLYLSILKLYILRTLTRTRIILKLLI